MLTATTVDFPTGTAGHGRHQPPSRDPPMHLQPRTLQSVFDLARLTFGQGRPPSPGQLDLLRRALGKRARAWGTRPCRLSMARAGWAVGALCSAFELAGAPWCWSRPVEPFGCLECVWIRI